ncbi:MAG: carbon storage regulator CsrA [Desulfuromonadaceae bacterium]|nr:carbon storage regulator CsrA [Desulfuromonadaceae bacterium]
MLVLTRKVGEGIVIGDDVCLTVIEIKGGTIRLGIDAPKDKKIYRQEVYLQIQKENRAATSWNLEDLDLLGQLPASFSPENDK